MKRSLTLLTILLAASHAVTAATIYAPTPRVHTANPAITANITTVSSTIIVANSNRTGAGVY